MRILLQGETYPSPDALPSYSNCHDAAAKTRISEAMGICDSTSLGAMGCVGNGKGNDCVFLRDKDDGAQGNVFASLLVHMLNGVWVDM